MGVQQVIDSIVTTAQRSFGDLFHACCDEIRDISFLEFLLRYSLAC
jgi:hypothetical protein